jgi:hypothetical protein
MVAKSIAKRFSELVLLSGLTLSGVAGAQTAVPVSCTGTPGPLYCYNWLTTGGALGADPFSSCTTPAAQIQLNHPECFPGGTSDAATAHRLITGTSIKHALAISTATTARLLSLGEGGPTGVASSGQKTGMAAGGAAQAWNVWGNISSTDSSYDRSGFTKSSGDVLNSIVGGDYKFGSMVAGVSAAFDRGNGSLGAAPATVITKGITIAPYMGMMLTKNLSLDASLGFGQGKFSSAGTTADADRTFFAANANYVTWLGNFQLTGKGNLISAVEKYGDTKTNGATNANTASKNKLDQARLGVEVGYWMNGLMPYLGLTYTNDMRLGTALSNGAPWDRNAFLLFLGLNFFSLKNGVTGGIVYSQEEGRSSSKNKNLVANISVRF